MASMDIEISVKDVPEVKRLLARVAALRIRLSQSEWIVCAEALAILDEDQAER